MIYARSNKKRLNTYPSTVNVDKGPKNDSFSIQYQRKIIGRDMLLINKKKLIKRELLLSKSSVFVTKVIKL